MLLLLYPESPGQPGWMIYFALSFRISSGREGSGQWSTGLILLKENEFDGFITFVRVDSGSFGCSSSLSASWGGTRSKPDTEPRVTKIGQIWSKFHQNSFKKPLFPVASRLLSVALRKHGHPGVRCSSRSSTYAPDLHEDSVGHRLTQGRRKGDPSEAGSRATSKPHGWVIPTPGEAGIG